MKSTKRFLIALIQDRSFKIVFLQSIIFLGLGMLFLHEELAAYGWVMFLCFPIILGISLGVQPNKRSVTNAVLIALVVFFLFIITTGIEGVICTIFLLPLIFPPLFLGFIVAHFVKRFREIRSQIRARLSWLPLSIFLIAVPIENLLVKNNKVIESVSTEIILDNSPLEVFNAIKSVDTLYGEKPLLMKLDLPIPHKCILEKEEVGAHRICYFEGGRIIEKVTDFVPGKLLRMDVVDYELTGRKWLGFKEAIYEFDSLGPNKTKMTRITTYTSELYPRAYWLPFEKLGISQEHDYVFQNVERILSELDIQ